MWIFVTTNRNTPLFNTVHHLLTVLEKYWVLTEVEMSSSLYQHLTRDHKQPLQSHALSPEYSHQHSSIRAFLLVSLILAAARHPTMQVKLGRSQNHPGIQTATRALLCLPSKAYSAINSSVSGASEKMQLFSWKSNLPRDTLRYATKSFLSLGTQF